MLPFVSALNRRSRRCKNICLTDHVHCNTDITSSSSRLGRLRMLLATCRAYMHQRPFPLFSKKNPPPPCNRRQAFGDHSYTLQRLYQPRKGILSLSVQSSHTNTSRHPPAALAASPTVTIQALASRINQSLSHICTWSIINFRSSSLA